MKKQIGLVLGILSLNLLALGCGEAVRDLKYAAYEQIGVEKRDLFQRQVKNARNDQVEANEEFKSALDRLRAAYNVKGGEFEKNYKRLQGDYDSCEDKAKDVKTSIEKLETVANDLFKEWKEEISQMRDENLKKSSNDARAQTIDRYRTMMASLKKSASRMDPILKKFRDHVWHAKHTLNAQMLNEVMKGESIRIQSEIQSLIDQMQKSIAESDKFIANLNETKS